MIKYTPIAFVPNRNLTIEVDGKEEDLYKEVSYMIPHALPRSWANELQGLGEGDIVYKSRVLPNAPPPGAPNAQAA